jgi:hypothetical protein
VRKLLVIALLILPLVTGLTAGRADARGCRARCRRAIALCAARACAQFHGALRAGCHRGLRITLIGACKAAPALNVCEDIQAQGCANN